jgi:hypothetical protein
MLSVIHGFAGAALAGAGGGADEAVATVELISIAAPAAIARSRLARERIIANLLSLSLYASIATLASP